MMANYNQSNQIKTPQHELRLKYQTVTIRGMIIIHMATHNGTLHHVTTTT